MTKRISKTPDHSQYQTALTPRRAAGRRGRASRRRPGLIRPAFLVAAAAVIAAVVLVPGLIPGTGPIAEFGKLPGIAVSSSPDSGGAGGPGFTFDLTYRLGQPLTAGWPTLPGRELAYRLQPHPHTEAAATRLAANLSITAPVTREGWQDSYLWAVDPGDGGPSLRIFPCGYTYFSQDYNYRPLSRGDLPPDDRAITVARNWLASSGFVPVGELNAGMVRTDDLDNGYLAVWFRPDRPGDVVTLAPWAMVQVGVAERIVTGSATWFPTETTSPYPLRNVADAWGVVEDGRGVLEWEIREYPGPAGDDNLITGEATVTQVRLAWALTFAADGTPYLVPVYAFSGTVVVPGAGGPVTLPFQVWAPAVTDEFTAGA